MSDNGDKSPSLGQQLTSLWKSIMGVSAASDPSLRESLEEALESRDDAGRTLTDQERHMLVNILSFGELRVDDVMVPRADVVALDENSTLDEVLALYRREQHSRMPLYRETLDDPTGMVHIKDVLEYLIPALSEGVPLIKDPFLLKSIRREVLFVPPSMPALDLLVKMQSTHVHLALVIDEYGGTDGLVSIEDLVEEIVGDIEDEHDTDEGPTLSQRADGAIDADARASVEELEEMTGLKLVDEENEDDIDTLGGLVVSLVGRVPVRGELIRHQKGLEFEVKDADLRRIKRLRIHRLPDAADTADGEPLPGKQAG